MSVQKVVFRVCMFLSSIHVCTVRAVFCSVLRKAEQNGMPRSFFYLGVTVVLNLEYGWLYDGFQMAYRVLCKSDRQADRHLQ